MKIKREQLRVASFWELVEEGTGTGAAAFFTANGNVFLYFVGKARKKFLHFVG